MKEQASVVIPNLAIKESKFPTKKYAQILGTVLRDFINEYQSEMKNKQIILCSEKEEICDTLVTYLAQTLEEGQRVISPNISSEEEVKGMEMHKAPIERDRKELNSGLTRHEKKFTARVESPNSEGYSTPPETEDSKCHKCGGKIRDRSHQANGRHLNRCIDCYNHKKAQKRAQREEQKNIS